MLCVHNDLVRAIDEQRIIGLVLLDLSAAFDTVDHCTLLSVLEKRFGVCHNTLAWFRSYLSDRTQTFQVNGVSSDRLPLHYSVPQGSSAGPVEFIAYTEDVSEVFNRRSVQYHLYMLMISRRMSAHQCPTSLQLELHCKAALAT